MKLFKFKVFKSRIFFVLIVAFALRVVLSFFGTLELDFNTFLAWSHRLDEVGFRDFYNAWSDYLPGYLYVLWLLGKLKTAASFSPLLYKLPAILADLGTSLLIYKIALKIKKRESSALILASLYLFNPAVLANSTLWGQVDSVPAFLGILALYLLDVNFILSAIILAIGTLVKPQTALVAGAVLFVFMRDKWSFKKFFLYVSISFLVFCLLFLPFRGGFPLFPFIVERIKITLGQYPYTSVNAFNFWGLFGFWKKDAGGVPPFAVGYLVTLAAFIYSFYKLKKVKKGEYVVLAVLYLSGFLFFTRMHERHLLASLAPILISSAIWEELIVPYFLLSLTYVANLYYSYIWITENFRQVFSVVFTKFLSLVNVFQIVYLFYVIVKGAKPGREKMLALVRRFIDSRKKGVAENNEYKFSKVKLSHRKTGLILGAILVFAFIARVFNLGSPPTMYFDEVYHAFTAKLVLHADPKAWEWWNPNPEGFAYEWTHPPLAKLAMALGMKVFGENAFGWRFSGAVLGAASVLLIYKIAREIFDDELLALMSAAVFSLDGLALTMSRIGMNDIYLLTFVLASVYFFLKKRDFTSAVMFGLAISSKWSAVWAIPVFGVLFLVIRKKFSPSLVWFFILPPLIYVLSYFQMFLTGHNFEIFIGMQKQMWWYHTNLRATHPYTSSWWSWPLDIRPVYLYTSEEVEGWVARIYNLGNPVVFWFGLFSVAVSLVYSFLEKNKKLAAVVFSYLVFFVPWAASPRIMFFYHYLPSLPFLAIASGYVLRRFPKIIAYFLVSGALLFIYFYPHWIGLKIPLWLDSSYYWFLGWR